MVFDNGNIMLAKIGLNPQNTDKALLFSFRDQFSSTKKHFFFLKRFTMFCAIASVERYTWEEFGKNSNEVPVCVHRWLLNR
jgi:hypothetical protein